MKPLRPSRSLKRPFVQTFAAGVAVVLSGCSSAIVADPACDGGACADRPVPGCPSAAPTSEAACTLSTRVTCTYGTRFNGCTNVPIEFSCDTTRHVWMALISTCNPPAPTCPTAVPAEGTACSPGIGPACMWPAGLCNGVAQQVSATCDPAARVWRVTAPTCAAPVCPDAQPTTGTPCVNPPTGALMCRYPGPPCGGVNNDIYAQCDATQHTWTLLVSSCNPPPPACPPTLPPTASACISTPATQNCTYPAPPCNGTPQTQNALCDPTTQRWVVNGPPSCNPPPPPPPDAGAVDAGVADGGSAPDA